MPTTSPHSTLVRVFIAGCVAILFQFTLGAAIVAFTQNAVWIAAAFFIGAFLGVLITQKASGLAFPAMGLLAATGVGPAFVVDVPLWGEIVNLRQVDDIPAGPSVSGYSAPGWRIDETRALQERLVAGRGNKSYGDRRIAPLVGDGWTPEHQVEVWVAGEIRDSRRVLPTHPRFWSEPDGEYARLVGVSVSGAQLQALRAARKYGLRTAEEPLIVTRRTSIAQAIRDQYLALAWALRWPFGAWIVIVGAGAALQQTRNKPKRRE